MLVNRYERDNDAREACIKHYGAVCYVCKFDFAIVYGSAFEGMIHVHHLVPIATINTEYRIDPIADLRPVCPNCHAVIHRRVPCYTIAEVQGLLTAQIAT
ncbi:MAG: HNH endonuclease [Acidobacteria bacterium]|nr:HNH endonuclease [Acidobacteriota bacterium]